MSGPVKEYEPEGTDGELVPVDGDMVAATKQEEWVKKKKVELTTTKQIETRVQRKIVLEDGKVVDDSGPLVTTTTTEDVDKQESEHTEHATHGDDMDGKEGWVPVEWIPEDAVVKEKNERKVTTHDELEDVVETEEVKHLGNVSNEGVVKAIHDKNDAKKLLQLYSTEKDSMAVSKRDGEKRVVNQSRRHDRTTDIEDTKEQSKMKEDGNMVTEITKRHEHEEYHNEDIPDSESDEFEHYEHKEGSRDYNNTIDENFIEYFVSPKAGSSSQRVKIEDGARIKSENISFQQDGDDDLWDSVSERMCKASLKNEAGVAMTVKSSKINDGTGAREDVVTNRPLDISQEEHRRKNETNRWLNSHFGSSSSSLNSEKSYMNVTPQGMHVTMTSRSSPVVAKIPTATPYKASKVTDKVISQNAPTMPAHFSNATKSQTHKGNKTVNFRGSTHAPTFDSNHNTNHVHFNLKDDSEHHLSFRYQGDAKNPMGSRRSWTKESTPTPPPRSRRKNSASPDLRNSNAFRTTDISDSLRSTMSRSPFEKNNEDVGQRKAYERKEESLGYCGPMSLGNQIVTKESLNHRNAYDPGSFTKHSNFYKTTELDNLAQNDLHKNGEGEVTGRKTVERTERVTSLSGPPQKHFHPKHIQSLKSSTVGRLNHKGPKEIMDSRGDTEHESKSRFYFGSSADRASISPDIHKEYNNDINVSISNSYRNSRGNNFKKPQNNLIRSMSFTPGSAMKEKSFGDQKRSHLRRNQEHASNPQLADLMSPRLITNLNRGRGDPYYGHLESTSNYGRDQESEYDHRFSNKRNTTKTMRGGHVIPVTPRSSLYSTVHTPNRILGSAASMNSIRAVGGADSPISDECYETHHMSTGTDEQNENMPQIKTDTTSVFSKRTLHGADGLPAGKVETTDTKTRTKSRFKESGVKYPGTSSSFRSNIASPGSVVIPVKESGEKSSYR